MSIKNRRVTFPQLPEIVSAGYDHALSARTAQQLSRGNTIIITPNTNGTILGHFYASFCFSLFKLTNASLSDMAPYYEGLCKELKWQLDSDLLSKMKKTNEEELKRLDDVLEDAEKNLGESEIRDAMMAKAEYLIRIGDKV